MKPTYEELEAKCQLQQDKLDAINELMGVIESASDLAKDGIQKLEQQLAESRREFTAANATIHNLELKVAQVVAESEKQQTHSEALSVDNAALHEVVERMVNQFAMSGISPEEKSINPAKSLMFDAKSALFMPATDAFLAEVRAQGVEMYAEATIAIGEEEGDEDIVYAGKQALLFAAQLRQGEKS